MHQFKPQIRLPGDHGPNPYDSSTKPQKPFWLQFETIFGVIALGVILVILRLH